MNFDELLEKELEKNQELKQLFEEHPEKKEQYKQKMLDSWDERTGFTQTEANEKAKYCKTCMFSHGKPPYADLPEKCHCMIFEYPNDKPNDVYYDGKPCEYYEKQKSND